MTSVAENTVSPHGTRCTSPRDHVSTSQYRLFGATRKGVESVTGPWVRSNGGTAKPEGESVMTLQEDPHRAEARIGHLRTVAARVVGHLDYWLEDRPGDIPDHLRPALTEMRGALKAGLAADSAN